MKNKRLLSVFMAVSIVVTSCCIGLFANAQDKHMDINKKMLDSILSDRYWIVETLADGNITNNPYAVVNPNVTSDTIMDEVLINYQNDKAFKTLVDAMEIYSNSGDYLSGLTDDVISVFENWFGDMDSVDDVVSSTEELKYESILNEVLITDYTSSWGDTLFDQNMNFENLKQKAEIFNKLSSYQTALKDLYGLSFADSSSIMIYNPGDATFNSYQIDIEEYVGHFLDAYSQDLETYLNSVIEIPSLEGNDALKKKIMAVGALAMVSLYEKTVAPETSQSLDELFYTGMFDDTMKVLNAAGKSLNIANKSMEYAILLEALQSQKNSTVDVMNRISVTTTDEDLQKVLNSYADLVNSQGDEQTLAYEVITDYLSNNAVITNIVQNKISQQGPKIIEAAAEKFGGAKGLVLQNAIASALSTASAVVSLSVWVADQTTGIEDTAKKIYICKYLDKIITEVTKTFKNDLNNYYSSRTDENAQKVLSDLQFLKALRLYGEKSAYGSMCSQMDSWIGILLGGGETLEYLQDRYQGSIDVLLGCALFPQTYSKMSLAEGDVLTILDRNIDGKNYCIADLTKQNGEKIYFAEADLRLMGGIDLNGATLNVSSAGNGFYLPLIDNDNDNSKINVFCNNVAFGEINNSAILNIKINNTEAIEVTDIIQNSGTLNVVNNSGESRITAYDIANLSKINFSNTSLYVKGTLNNSGSISGKVHICGESSLGYNNAYFKMEMQAIKGYGTYTDIYFENNHKKGVLLLDSFTVTDFVSNTDKRIQNSVNLTLTDNCIIENGYLNSGATLKNFTSSQAVTFNGEVNSAGEVALQSECVFNDSLIISEDCTSLSQSGVTVKGDLFLNGGSISGLGAVNLRGNFSANTDSPVINNLQLCGLQSQIIDSNSELTVNTLVNNNKSVGGVTFDCTVYVTKSLDNNVIPACKNGKNIILTGDAVVIGNKINTSVSAKDWNMNSDLEIKGTLYAAGNINLLSGVHLDLNDYYQTSGNLILADDAQISCKNSFYNAAVTNSNGIINVTEDSVIDSSFSGGIFNTSGDISATADFAPDTLNFDSSNPQSFSNSAQTQVKVLNINNDSKSGFNVGSIIYVSDQFINNCKNLINSQNIILTDDCAYLNQNGEVGNLNISGDITVNAGESLVVNGDVNLKSGGSITVENGAQLIINGHINAGNGYINAFNDSSITVNEYVDLNSTTLNINENAEMNINDYIQFSSANLNINGILTVKSDAKLISCIVDSNGVMNLYGDLNSDSCTWNNANISFIGQTPQVVSGSAVNVNDLIIDNASKSGVTFESKVNYNMLDSGNSVVNGRNNLIANS